MFKVINKINKMKAHIIMLLNGFVLIILGIAGYFMSGSPTALIATAVGAVLLIFSQLIKKENSFVAHIGIIFTVISSAVFFFVGIKRSNALIIIMAVITLLAFLYYLIDFIVRRNERAAKN